MNKTKKLIASVSSASVAVMLSGCNDYSAEELPPEPTDTECQDWEWDADDGVYECDDTNSRYFGSYFYGGKYYKGKSSLLKSSAYKSYKSSSSFKGGGSGFGGSKGFGG
ncbi:aminotransferase yhxA [Fictibacillus sp. UD]|uniref:aminotransferase yhxA n=1 Tax=Fictibacillus sp. UD TaxID=3038777 RepID=UPI00374754F1